MPTHAHLCAYTILASVYAPMYAFQLVILWHTHMKHTNLEKKHFPLKDTTIASLEPSDKAYRIRDSSDSNLYLYVRPDGRKSWEVRYKKAAGLWPFMGIGSYGKQDGSLTGAEARAKVNALLDAKLPNETLLETQQRLKTAIVEADQNTLAALTQEWIAIKTKVWVPATATRNIGALQKHILPTFGQRPFVKIKAKEWLDHFTRMQATGIVEMTNRVLVLCRDILDFAVDSDRMEANPLARMHKRLERHTSDSMKHVSPSDVPKLVQDIRGYATHEGRIGLQLLMLLACRPGELLGAEWSEFDLDAALWTIPARRMKRIKAEKEREGAAPYIRPLPVQAVALLKELHYINGSFSFLFPGRGDAKKTKSSTFFLMALRRLGYENRQTAHGFRHIFSTAANEAIAAKTIDFSPDVVEGCLAHFSGDVRGKYNLAQYVEPRRQLLQWWANTLYSMLKGDS